MASALIAAEGVLRVRGKTIPEGRRLVSALAQVYRVVIALDDNEVDAFGYWAKMESIKGHTEVLPGLLPLSMRGGDPRVAQIDFLRGRGEHLALLVDADPTHVQAAFEQGMLGMLFCDPGLMRPEWRPDWDETPTPWADLVAEIERQHYTESQQQA